MGFEMKRSDGLLCAVGEMTIYSAQSMKEQLLSSAFETGGDWLLDASRVTELDTCGVQVLLMMQRLAIAEQRTFKLAEPSPAVREALGLSGLSSLHEAHSGA
jgi:anti-sigma B factor antagonist